VICMIGEIGGPQEAEAAGYIKDHVKKTSCRLRGWSDGAKRSNYGACGRHYLCFR
jgi:succinyl-CoA synthetase alpha subunit